jgi:hypothetical protein
LAFERSFVSFGFTIATSTICYLDLEPPSGFETFPRNCVTTAALDACDLSWPLPMPLWV